SRRARHPLRSQATGGHRRAARLAGSREHAHDHGLAFPHPFGVRSEEAEPGDPVLAVVLGSHAGRDGRVADELRAPLEVGPLRTHDGTTLTTPRRGARRGRGTSTRVRAAEAAAPPAAESSLDTFLAEPAPAAEAPPASEPLPPMAAPELRFAARVPPPEPARPLPTTRRVIFFDVENTSRAEHI